MNPQPARRTGFGLWDSHRQVARRQQRLRDEAEQAPPGPDEDPGLPPPDPATLGADLRVPDSEDHRVNPEGEPVFRGGPPAP